MYDYTNAQADLNQDGIIMQDDPLDQFIFESICSISDTLNTSQFNLVQSELCITGGTLPGSYPSGLMTTTDGLLNFLTPIPSGSSSWPVTYAAQQQIWIDEYNGVTDPGTPVTQVELITILGVYMAFQLAMKLANKFRVFS